MIQTRDIEAYSDFVVFQVQDVDEGL